MKKLLIPGFILLLAACSGGENPAGKNQVDEHVWQSQTDMMGKARNLEGIMQDSASAKQQEADRQVRGLPE